MRKFQEVEIKTVKSLISSIACNRCGKSKKLDLDAENYDVEWQLNEFHHIGLNFGYGSNFDMDVWHFDLCEKCLVDIVRTFKYLPDGYDEKYVNKVFKVNKML